MDRAGYKYTERRGMKGRIIVTVETDSYAEIQSVIRYYNNRLAK